MSITTPSVAPTVASEVLVENLTEQIAHLIARPAVEALGERRGGRVRERVAVLVQAGNLEAARAMVSDEITLASLSVEISRHIGSCWTCAVPMASSVECHERARMESRERRLLDLVANAGGLR